MPPFKDEHILLISPGSRTTLAQLGLPESFSPAKISRPTRMFPAEIKGQWEPVKIRAKSDERKDVAMNGDSAAPDVESLEKKVREDSVQFEEDLASDESAVYPLVDGRIVNWPCFLALLTHIYETLSPPFHTPILIITQPCWTSQDREALAQFFFERFQTPALSLMDAALATCYAYATSSATIIDVGYTKSDLTTITDHAINDLGRLVAVPDCGGEAMTQQLVSLLQSQNLDRIACEQLKRDSICEILPPGVDLPLEEASKPNALANPAAAISTGATSSGDGHRETLGAKGAIPRGPGLETEVGEADEDREVRDGEDEEGVLDVANIVASGKTSEFLARKEKEKAEKANAKKAAADAAASERKAKMPNSRRARAIFQCFIPQPIGELLQRQPSSFERRSQIQNLAETASGNMNSPMMARGVQNEVTTTNQSGKLGPRGQEDQTVFARREVEVGLERFKAASDGILDRIADCTHRCIMSVPDPAKRSDLWDNIVIVGNGSKIRGFKEALLAILHQRFLISANNASIFRSELPSNQSTPMATGANTPQPLPPSTSFQSPAQHFSHQPSSSVNPLLHAATTGAHAMMANTPNFSAQTMAFLPHNAGAQLSTHSQTPSSIKILRPPEYFLEWKEHGMEEASFLGAQVAARVVFILDQGSSKGFMTRSEYNELGPTGIGECCLGA